MGPSFTLTLLRYLAGIIIAHRHQFGSISTPESPGQWSSVDRYVRFKFLLGSKYMLCFYINWSVDNYRIFYCTHNCLFIYSISYPLSYLTICFVCTVSLPRCHWSYPEGYGQISWGVDKTEHNKSRMHAWFLSCLLCTSLEDGVWRTNLKINVSNIYSPTSKRAI